MKPESMITLLLVFSLVTITIGGIIGDMNIQYGTNVSNNWSTKYNFQTQINESVTNVLNDVQKVGKADGWLEIGLAGAGAVFKGIGTMIIMIISVPGYAISIIMGVAGDLQLPDVVVYLIIPIFILMIFVAIAFSVLKFAKGDAI